MRRRDCVPLPRRVKTPDILQKFRVLKLDELTIAGTPWITGVAFTTDAKERLRSFAEKGKNA